MNGIPFREVGWSVLILVLMFLPSELWLILRYFLSPEGFWQNFVVFGLGVWILGGFQFVGLILGGVSLYAIWKEV